ncbi:MAG: hypothetical protein AAFV37_09445 [Pseudomonadota bacterium]
MPTENRSYLTSRLGPRPRMTLVVQEQMIAEIWVNGRAPIITIHDYDWGASDPDPAYDGEGFAYSPINWNRPAWMLGLSLYLPELGADPRCNTYQELYPSLRIDRT